MANRFKPPLLALGEAEPASFIQIREIVFPKHYAGKVRIAHKGRMRDFHYTVSDINNPSKRFEFMVYLDSERNFPIFEATVELIRSPEGGMEMNAYLNESFCDREEGEEWKDPQILSPLQHAILRILGFVCFTFIWSNISCVHESQTRSGSLGISSSNLEEIARVMHSDLNALFW